MTLRLAPLDTVRSAIAHCWLGPVTVASSPSVPSAHPRLGGVTLRPHQSDALHQVTDLIETQGGAVLADAVGMGKTYVALAVASRAAHVLVVCPAVLSEVWRRSARDTGVTIDRVSMERLSRDHGAGSGDHGRPSLVIVDEAHHFRNPHTRRYRALARLTASARVLLVTATPVHNRVEDLASLLSLFLGAAAWTMTDDQQSRYVVRRDHNAALTSTGTSADAAADASHAAPLAIPPVVGPHVLHVDDDVQTLNTIVALPAPVPPRDGEVSAALTTMGLVRQWASSAGALRAALRRRLERAAALEASLERGAYPSYRDLRDWCVGEGTIQLALPELFASPQGVGPDPGSGEACASSAHGLLAAVRAHSAAVRALLDRVTGAQDVDAARAHQLREIMRAHRDAKVVAFSSFEDTVHAIYRHLRGDGGICALSARGGVIAGGQLGRAAVLRQFAPGSGNRVQEAQRIRLLLATDLVSEGVDLHGAAVVVHLDLPWTPARLEQRVGRVARMGSQHPSVTVYALAPPAASEVLLHVERRLRAKLDAAGRAIGIAGSIVPRLSAAWPLAQADVRAAGPPEELAAVRSIVSAWPRSPSAPASTGDALWGQAAGAGSGFLAACIANGRPLLVAATGEIVSDAPAVLAAAARSAQGARDAAAATSCDDAISAVQAWWSEPCAIDDAGLATITGATSRHRVLRRIAAISRRSPMHTRPTILALGERARRAATARYGAGAEWVLDQLAGATLPDAQWLRAVAAFGDAHAARASRTPLGREIEVKAVIVFGGQ